MTMLYVLNKIFSISSILNPSSYSKHDWEVTWLYWFSQSAYDNDFHDISSLVNDPSVDRFNGSRENRITRKSSLIVSTLSRILCHLRPCAYEKKYGVNVLSRLEYIVL